MVELKDLVALKHGIWGADFNMLKCPMIHCDGNAEKFNEIYLSINGLRKTWKEMVLTKSGVPSKSTKGRWLSNFEKNIGSRKIWVSPGQVRVMWIYSDLVWYLGFRSAKTDKDAISGRRAFEEVMKVAEKKGISLNEWRVSKKEELMRIKEEIPSPRIQVECDIALGKEVKHVAHLDIHSAYAAGVMSYYPQLAPLYREIYELRKKGKNHIVDGAKVEAKKYYKMVLTNSIGYMQSPKCTDWYPALSKAAHKWTRDKIDELIEKMKKKGYIPLLSNTDGIWYCRPAGESEWYHDEDEGTDIGQWGNEYIDSTIRIYGSGKYDFKEADGTYNVRLRGRLKIERTKPREIWTWGENMLGKDNSHVIEYYFYEDKGLVPKEEWEYGVE